MSGSVVSTRWGRGAFTASETQAIRDRLDEVLRAGDVLPLLPNADGLDERAIGGLTDAIIRALPNRIVDLVADLRRGRYDALLLDGEPERTDLPPTLEGLDRQFVGGLASDWLSLTYARLLGAATPDRVGLGQLRVEWQFDSDGLHRDSVLWRRERRWQVADFSSLACIRAGGDHGLATVVAHRREVFGQLAPQHLRWLTRPLFRYRELAPLATGEPAPLICAHPDGGWDMNPSLVWGPARAKLDTTCDDPRAKPALTALLDAYWAFDRYPTRVRWRPGRRLILSQRDHYHGRSGRLAGPLAVDERWMTRANVLVGGDARDRRTAAWSPAQALAHLEPRMAGRKLAWLRREESARSVAFALGRMGIDAR